MRKHWAKEKSLVVIVNLENPVVLKENYIPQEKEVYLDNLKCLREYSMMIYVSAWSDIKMKDHINHANTLMFEKWKNPVRWIKQDWTVKAEYMIDTEGVATLHEQKGDPMSDRYVVQMGRTEESAFFKEGRLWSLV